MGTSTARLQLYKPDGTETVDEAVDLNANWDRVESGLAVSARFCRRASDGTQTLNAGDQALSFPTQVYGSSLVTPSGTGNTSFLLQPGHWVISAGLRVNTSASFGLYLSKSSTFTDENNVINGDNVTSDLTGHATDSYYITTPTSFCVGVFRGGTACNAIGYGSDLTHVVFTRMGVNGNG